MCQQMKGDEVRAPGRRGQSCRELFHWFHCFFTGLVSLFFNLKVWSVCELFSYGVQRANEHLLSTIKKGQGNPQNKRHCNWISSIHIEKYIDLSVALFDSMQLLNDVGTVHSQSHTELQYSYLTLSSFLFFVCALPDFISLQILCDVLKTSHAVREENQQPPRCLQVLFTLILSSEALEFAQLLSS